MRKWSLQISYIYITILLTSYMATERTNRMRITKKVFNDLAIFMVFLGVLVGIAFPFFVLLFDVPRETAFQLVFFGACIAAGILLAIMNYQLAKRVVGTRIRELSTQMKHVEGILSGSKSGVNCQTCSPETCSIRVDSEDEIGDSAASFNRLILTLSEVMEAQTDLQRFSALLTTHLELDDLSNETLLYLMEATGANGGALLLEHSGELEIAASYAIHELNGIGVNSYIQQAMKKQERQTISFPDDIILDGVLTQFRPKEIIIEPIVFKKVLIGMLILASTTPFSQKSLEKLSVYGPILSVAFNNAITHQQMQQLAALDALTGIYNRRFGSNRIQEEFVRSIRSGIPMSLIMLDIDHFKSINDSYGHMIGDRAIVMITKSIKDAIREGDVMIRYGGEEFLCLLPGANQTDARQIAERIRILVKDTVVKNEDQEIHVTVSLGTTTYPNDDIQDIQQLIQMADTAMYNAKKSGRNRVVCM